MRIVSPIREEGDIDEQGVRELLDDEVNVADQQLRLALLTSLTKSPPTGSPEYAGGDAYAEQRANAQRVIEFFEDRRFEPPEAGPEIAGESELMMNYGFLVRTPIGRLPPLFEALGLTPGMSFFDPGCGGGEVCDVAGAYVGGRNSHGREIRPSVSRWALAHRDEVAGIVPEVAYVDLAQGDSFSEENEDLWRKADVIYCFYPVPPHRETLYRRVFEQHCLMAKPGTKIIVLHSPEFPILQHFEITDQYRDVCYAPQDNDQTDEVSAFRIYEIPKDVRTFLAALEEIGGPSVKEGTTKPATGSPEFAGTPSPAEEYYGERVGHLILADGEAVDIYFYYNGSHYAFITFYNKQGESVGYIQFDVWLSELLIWKFHAEPGFGSGDFAYVMLDALLAGFKQNVLIARYSFEGDVVVDLSLARPIEAIIEVDGYGFEKERVRADNPRLLARLQSPAYKEIHFKPPSADAEPTTPATGSPEFAGGDASALPREMTAVGRVTVAAECHFEHGIHKRPSEAIAETCSDIKGVIRDIVINLRFSERGVPGDRHVDVDNITGFEDMVPAWEGLKALRHVEITAEGPYSETVLRSAAAIIQKLIEDRLFEDGFEPDENTPIKARNGVAVTSAMLKEEITTDLVRLRKLAMAETGRFAFAFTLPEDRGAWTTEQIADFIGALVGTGGIPLDYTVQVIHDPSSDALIEQTRDQGLYTVNLGCPIYSPDVAVQAASYCGIHEAHHIAMKQEELTYGTHLGTKLGHYGDDVLIGCGEEAIAIARSLADPRARGAAVYPPFAAARCDYAEQHRDTYHAAHFALLEVVTRHGAHLPGISARDAEQMQKISRRYRALGNERDAAYHEGVVQILDEIFTGHYRVARLTNSLRAVAESAGEEGEIVVAFDTNIAHLDKYAGALFEALEELHKAEGLENVRIITGSGATLSARVNRYLRTIPEERNVQVVALGQTDNVGRRAFAALPEGTRIVPVNDTAVIDGGELIYRVDVPGMIERVLSDRDLPVIYLEPTEAVSGEELRHRFEEEAYYMKMA
jgi:hypothetical protein